MCFSHTLCGGRRKRRKKTLKYYTFCELFLSPDGEEGEKEEKHSHHHQLLFLSIREEARKAQEWYQREVKNIKRNGPQFGTFHLRPTSIWYQFLRFLIYGRPSLFLFFSFFLSFSRFPYSKCPHTWPPNCTLSQALLSIVQSVWEEEKKRTNPGFTPKFPLSFNSF